MSHLQQQRDSISGVNLDEEVASMVQYQQAFEAASRYINVVNDITNTLINLGR
jgi:flagellar hook-associated protein 1